MSSVVTMEKENKDGRGRTEVLHGHESLKFVISGDLGEGEQRYHMNRGS